MPKRTQKLYQVFDGELEVVNFLEQSIVQGAFAETWLVYSESRNTKIRCAIGTYFETPHQAWQDALKWAENSLAHQEEDLKKAKANIKLQKDKIATIKQMVKQTLTPARTYG